MRFEQIALLLGGLAIIGACFLPFIELSGEMLGPGANSTKVSGMSVVQAILDKTGVQSYSEGQDLMNFFQSKWSDPNTSIQQKGLLGGIWIILFGPLFFALHALGYIFKGLRGKQYSRGIFFTLLFVGLGWLIFWLFGKEDGQSYNFFSTVQTGFWVAIGGMLLAAFSLFFEKGGSDASSAVSRPQKRK